jgi:thioesterase domain-containing protein
MRKHRFRGRLRGAQLVYFRAQVAGACDYVDDGRRGAWAHGVCWSQLCDDVEVVDVPGDHFSLLRQGDADMSVLLNTLKRRLAPFGWTEVLRPAAGAGARPFALPASEVEDLEGYLARMGVSDAATRSRLAGALPFASLPREPTGGGSPAVEPAERRVDLAALVMPANSAAMARLRTSTTSTTPQQQQQPVWFIVLDSTRSGHEVDAWVTQLSAPVFYLQLPPQWHCEQLPALPDLARLLHTALRAAVRCGPYVVAGVGLGGVLAHELAVQVCQAGCGGEVVELVMIESAALRRAWEAAAQPWLQLYWWVAGWRPDLDMAAEYASVGRTLGSRGGHQSQLDYIASLCPAGYPRDVWEGEAEQRTRAAAARCSGGGDTTASDVPDCGDWRETVYSWCCLYQLLQQAHAEAAGAPFGMSLESFIVQLYEHENE